jgi:predicted O-methyltransferase YrrM
LASRQTIKSENPFANLFPGDHYRILSGLMLELQPKVIVDIGTHFGTGTRIFLDYAPGAVVHTFDVLPLGSF